VGLALNAKNNKQTKTLKNKKNYSSIIGEGKDNEPSMN
jgi:hypothetical protein